MRKILLISTAWGSKHGGVNVFNYRIACTLKKMGHDVTVCVKYAEKNDLKDAYSKGITLLDIEDSSGNKWEISDLAKLTTMDENEKQAMYDNEIIIVHDIISCEFLECLDKFNKKPFIISFLHTNYSLTDYQNNSDDGETKDRESKQIDIIVKSDITFTSGSWLSSVLHEKIERREILDRIKPFIPGRIEHEDYEHKSDTKASSILIFGRIKELNNFENKGGKATIEAYKKLVRDRKFNNEEWVLPELAILGASISEDKKNEIKDSITNHEDSEARVRFYDFNHYYDFWNSKSHERLKAAKLVIVPSRVETFGLTILESVCLGIPVIASKNSGFYKDYVKVMSKTDDGNWTSEGDTHGIQWLEKSHFNELDKYLADYMQRIFRNYDEYNSRAQAISEEINTQWPKWESECSKIIEEFSIYRSRLKVEENDKLEKRKQEEAEKQRIENSVFCNEEMRNLKSYVKKFEPISASKDKSNETSLIPDHSSLMDLANTCYRYGQLGEFEHLKNGLQQEYGGRNCTQLQQALFDKLSEGGVEPYQDILLCGSTSSGKTTAAELLFGIANDNDFAMSRIVYLAPTRALAQERWRAWNERYSKVPTNYNNENVIISTGEDHTNDRAIAKSNFLIACLVNEKANVILSTTKTLLSNLNMIVVDELHMLEDTQRGPIIETLLAKVQHEKERRKTLDDYERRPLRIVAITTENTASEEFSTYLSQKKSLMSVELIPPIKATQNSRPCIVNHHLVIPEQNGDESFRKILVGKFEKDDKLSVTEDELRSKTSYLSFRNNSEAENSRIQNDNRKYQYVDFIIDWLEKNKSGKRLLVFTGSKIGQRELADALQGKIKKNYNLKNRERVAHALDKIYEEIETEDSPLSKSALRRWLDQGLFIHNSDLHKELRYSIEEYLELPLHENTASEVVLSTTTLNYGVNLSIDDVAILEIDFPSSLSGGIKTNGDQRKLLSHCQFMNMCGRAGRLNQNNQEADVYLWAVAHEKKMSPKRIVEYFYSQKNRFQNNIIHRVDIAELNKMKKQNAENEAPTRFSYPLVRSVLDGLRYIGGPPGQIGVLKQNGSTLKDIHSDFILYLFSATKASMKDDDRNESTFVQCFDMTIEASTSVELNLIAKVNQGYKITPLGSSIIDTGTEITTLAPLKWSLESLLSLTEKKETIQLPVEALLLPIVLQSEAHRRYLHNMPEIRSEVSSTDNRGKMLDWLTKHYESKNVDTSFIDIFKTFLELCDENPKHANLNTEVSSSIIHDGCLRLFCGLLMWVSGESISKINEILSQIGVITGQKTTLSVNFSNFAELVSWKLQFMTMLMRFDRKSETTRVLTSDAMRLILRLKLGSRSEALPLLSPITPNMNRKLRISRKEAHQLITIGANQTNILNEEFDYSRSSFPPSKRGTHKKRVKEFTKYSFKQLSNDYIYGSLNEGVEGMCVHFWKTANNSIGNMLSGKSSKEDTFFHENDLIVEASHGADSDENPKLRIITTASTLRIIGRRLIWNEEDMQEFQDAVNITFSILPNDENSTDFLVVFPYVDVVREKARNGQRIISPAAFGIFLTLISRKFFNDSITAVEAILKYVGSSINSAILMDILSDYIVMKQLPDTLFDSWASYIDPLA